MSFSLTCALHTPLPPPPCGGLRKGFVDVFCPPSLSTPGSRASTASAAAVLTSSSSSRPRHHKSLSTSAHPNSPDLHAHQPRQVVAQLPCWAGAREQTCSRHPDLQKTERTLFSIIFAECAFVHAFVLFSVIECWKGVWKWFPVFDTTTPLAPSGIPFHTKPFPY